MPVKYRVGYGDCTPKKMDDFSSIIGMHLSITEQVLTKHLIFHQTYRYVDLTAGRGYTPNGLVGSSIAFLRKVAEEKTLGNFSHAFQADFVECDPENLDELQNVVQQEGSKHEWGEGNLKFYLGNYEDVVKILFPTKDDRELGLAFVDPTGNLPDFEGALKYISQMRPRMEILIYLASTNVKRIRQFTHKRLDYYIDSVGKLFWLVRKPISWDQFKWTFLLGANTDIFKDYKKIGMVRLDSETGKEVLERLMFTKTEQKELRQGKLF